LPCDEKQPSKGNTGKGILAIAAPREDSPALLTSAGQTAWRWLHELAARLERVRVVHGAWDRCLNNHYGGDSTAVFLDPPYRSFEGLYGSDAVADAVETWAREHAHLRVALCGHRGDYPSLEGWDETPWTRKRLTYSSDKTTDNEAIWFSPACIAREGERQQALFG
jgi:16S rRNA G966 N2-methylase RsmD